MKPFKFLLVEDEVIISMSIEEALNSFGYMNIQKVFDAETALKCLSNTKFDIVLMDINLGGGKDGIDVMNEIKKHSDIPFIYITGNSDYKTVHKAKYSYPDGFIIKPFNETDLKITLELVLHKIENKLNKKERKNTNSEFSFEEDVNNLVIRLGADGEIHYVNSYIKKITDKPAVYYYDKKIEESGFDPFFTSTLTNILNEAKNSNRHLFYCNVKNYKMGERVMEILVTPDDFSNNSFGSYVFRFKDVTENYTDSNAIAIAEKNKTLNNNASNVFMNTITKREKEILSLVMKGMSNKNIGDFLNISPKTVSIHRTNLMKKLNAKNAPELVKIAIENNFIVSINQ